MISATRAEFVIDASAAGLVIEDNPRSDGYARWFQSTFETGARRVAPSLIRYELAAVVFKHVDHARLRAHPSLVVDLVRDATEGIELDEEAWVRCGRLAGKVSAYDACYLALAVQREATLVTMDAKLAKLAARHVPVLDPRAFV